MGLDEEALKAVIATLEPGEEVKAALTQKSVVGGARTIVVTNYALHLRTPRMFGASYISHEWISVASVTFEERMLSAELRIAFHSGEALIVDKLPIEEGREFFGHCRAQHRGGYSERRRQMLEEERARSGRTLFMSGDDSPDGGRPESG